MILESMQEQNFNDNSHTWPRQRAIPLPGLSEGNDSSNNSNSNASNNNSRPSDGLLDAKSLFANLFLPNSINTSNHDDDDTNTNTNINHRSSSAAPQSTVNSNNTNNRPISAPPRDLGVFGPESSTSAGTNSHSNHHNLNHNAHTYNGASSSNANANSNSNSNNSNADYSTYGLNQRRPNSTSAVNYNEPTNNFDALLLQHGNALNHNHATTNKSMPPGKSISTPPGMEHAIFSNSNSQNSNSNSNSNSDHQLGLRRPASTGLINHHNHVNQQHNQSVSAYSSGMHQYIPAAPARASSAAPEQSSSSRAQTLMDFIIRENDPYDNRKSTNASSVSPSPHHVPNGNTANTATNANGGYSDPQQQTSSQYQHHPPPVTQVSYAMPPHQIQYMNMPPPPPHHPHPHPPHHAHAHHPAAYGTVQMVYYQAPPPPPNINVEGQAPPPPPQTVYAAAPYYAVQYHAPPHPPQVRGVGVGVGVGAATPALPYWTTDGPGGNLVAQSSQPQSSMIQQQQQQQMQNHHHHSNHHNNNNKVGGSNNHHNNHKSNNHGNNNNNKSSKSDRRRNNKRGDGVHKHNNHNNNGSLSQGDLLLEEFRAAKNRNWTIHQIKGHVVEFCKDQNGSRFIQQRLEVADSVEKNMVMRELLPAIRELRNDVFGNYVIQKLLEFGGDDIKEDLAGTLYGEMLSLSLQMYGCRVVQKALETLDDEAMSRLIQEFRGNVVTCIHDQNGNHVIQKCVEVLSNKAKRGNATAASEMEFIINDVLDNTASLSCHPYGCRVLQRILEHCLLPQQFRALDEILECHGDLLDDQYGNYVIQHVLQFGRDSDRESILNLVVQGGLLTLSRQKFASNVVEKLLKYGSPIQRNKIVIEMLKPSGEGTSEVDGSTTSVVLLMVRDAYANYVVQTILDVLSEGEEKVKLLKELNDHADQLRNYTFAKHIVTKLGAA